MDALARIACEQVVKRCGVGKGVIVKSGVQPFESSGDLIGFCHLDTIFELDSGHHLRQVIETP